MAELLVFGAGYSGLAIARAALERGLSVAITSRGTPFLPPGSSLVPFAEAREAIARARYVVATAAPTALGDPVLQAWGGAIRDANLAWIGYLSTTGIYGDRQGGWVDENTPPAPAPGRSTRRLDAEIAWRDHANARPLDIVRLAGIYGPGRSALDDIRAGRARRIVKPGHAFGRIHRDDIAAGIMAAIARPPDGTRVLNFADDLPAESADVISEAARLLGAPPQQEVPFETAWQGMSDMGRSFWAENRKVSARQTKQSLGIAWLYPTYREGLAAILAEESAHRPTQA